MRGTMPADPAAGCDRARRTVGARPARPRAAVTTSVTRRPNSSSITTTSPRAIGLPLTSRSTGSPARRLSVMIEPGPRASVSPIVMRVRPISTASSTGTSCSRVEVARGDRGRRRSSGADGRLERHVVDGLGLGLVVARSWLLHRQVGEQDVVRVDVGLLVDPLEDLACAASRASSASSSSSRRRPVSTSVMIARTTASCAIGP